MTRSIAQHPTRQGLINQIENIAQLRLFEGLEILSNDTIIMRPILNRIAANSGYCFESIRNSVVGLFVSKGWLVRIGRGVYKKAGDFAMLTGSNISQI